MHWTKVVRTATPSALPVTLAELKAHLHLEDGDASQDTILTIYLNAAVENFDGRGGLLGRALVTQTWQWTYPYFLARQLRFGCGPVQSVTLKYRDMTGTEQTMSSSLYKLSEDALSPFVDLNETATWPDTAVRPDAVTLDVVCGYGDATAVPAQIKLAILMNAADMFLNRESQQSGLMKNPMYQSIIHNYRATGY